jgi:hypothetical protein
MNSFRPHRETGSIIKPRLHKQIPGDPMTNLLRPFLAAACFPTLIAASDAVLVGAGVNYSTTDLEDGGGVEYSARPGFNAALGFEKQVRDGFYVVPMIGLDTRGEKAEGEFLGSPFKGELQMLYLQIPVFAMYKVPVSVFSLQVFAGPSLGINLVSDVESRSGGSTTTDNISGETERFDFGVEAGAGLEFAVPGGSVFVRPSYYMGLREALDGGEKLRSFRLQAGFLTPLGFPAP